jgi:predicted RNA-binding protein with PIN domain
MSGDSPAVGLPELPDDVRHRVLALTADALPSVPRLPAPVRKVADFAPSRRAKLGGTLLASSLGDDDFRERVATQVGATLPAPLADLTAAPAGTDPVEVAALAWLLRPEGWQQLLAGALERVPTRSGPDPAAEAERWRAKAEGAEQALREARAKHREGLADLKAENASLRRKLGETRVALRDAVAAADAASSAVDQARREGEGAASAQDKEIRQLRAQVERLQAEAQASRRTARADRDEATLRARLLLDTVIDAASGLRRELSLPPVTGAPADRLEAELAGGETGTVGGASPLSPAMVEQHLALPRARLLVDGYNISKTAWPTSSLETQRIRLLNGLAPLVARTGAETTVVFDAAATANRPVVAAPRGVKVRFSPEGVIADDVIRDLVAAEPEGRVVLVVTSDQALARDVARAGARVVPASVLAAVIGAS